VTVAVERREGGGDGDGGVGAEARGQSKNTQLHTLITDNDGRSKDLPCVGERFMPAD
jgi:hypothetical protein